MLKLRNRTLNKFKNQSYPKIVKKVLKRKLSQRGKTLLIKASPISLMSKNRKVDASGQNKVNPMKQKKANKAKRIGLFKGCGHRIFLRNRRLLFLSKPMVGVAA